MKKIVFLVLAFCSTIGLVHARQAPVAFVLAATDKVVLTNPKGRTYSALPTHRLLRGHAVNIPKGQRFSVAVLSTGHRRVFNGPARLKVIADTVRVVKGTTPKVFPIAQANLDLMDQWLDLYSRPRVPSDEANMLSVIQPIDGSLLLTRSPEFVFKGDLPREGSLMLFDAKGKRFWVEPIENQFLNFPAAAKFDWGQSFTWEVRRLTGGRVLTGSFHIASEETARALLEAKVPNTPRTLPEAHLFYGMRLQLANAFLEANEVWQSLGFYLSAQGNPESHPSPL